MTKKEIFDLLRQLEIADSGIEAEDITHTEPMADTLEAFKQGYTACLNEVKKSILAIKE